jgi:hypothetical protein
MTTDGVSQVAAAVLHVSHAYEYVKRRFSWSTSFKGSTFSVQKINTFFQKLNDLIYIVFSSDHRNMSSVHTSTDDTVVAAIRVRRREHVFHILKDFCLLGYAVACLARVSRESVAKASPHGLSKAWECIMLNTVVLVFSITIRLILIVRSRTVKDIEHTKHACVWVSTSVSVILLVWLTIEICRIGFLSQPPWSPVGMIASSVLLYLCNACWCIVQCKKHGTAGL